MRTRIKNSLKRIVLLFDNFTAYLGINEPPWTNLIIFSTTKLCRQSLPFDMDITPSFKCIYRKLFFRELFIYSDNGFNLNKICQLYKKWDWNLGTCCHWEDHRFFLTNQCYIVEKLNMFIFYTFKWSNFDISWWNRHYRILDLATTHTYMGISILKTWSLF